MTTTDARAETFTPAELRAAAVAALVAFTERGQADTTRLSAGYGLNCDSDEIGLPGLSIPSTVDESRRSIVASETGRGRVSPFVAL